MSQKQIDAQRKKEKTLKQSRIAYDNYNNAVRIMMETATTDTERMVAAKAQMEHRCAMKAYSDADFELYCIEDDEAYNPYTDPNIDEDALAFDKWWHHDPDDTND